MYRKALELRHRLQTTEDLSWVESVDPAVLSFTRPGGWHSVTNFGTAPVELPAGRVVLSSGPLAKGVLPPDTTAWLA
jgi:alpha-glucosidase